LPDSELFPALWESALLEKKLGRHDAKLALLLDLAGGKNPYRLSAYEELAKHYERHARHLELALQMTEAALEIEASEQLVRRKQRLAGRLQRQAEKSAKRLFQQV
jgi:outer membrane protein TolC